MLLIPQDNTTYGLIQKCNILGSTKVSSTNYLIDHQERKDNPIKYTTGDRWCSEATNQHTPQWWKVKFNHWIYPTNYSISNNQMGLMPVGWKFQGKKKHHEWVDLSIIEHSTIPNNASSVFKLDIDEGPFRTFRLISTENGVNTETGDFHFCIYKFELFGVAFRDYCSVPIKSSSKLIFTISLIYLLI